MFTLPAAEGYWLTRWVFQRALGVIYFVAFLNALNQFRPLLGERGLLPVSAWVKAVPFRQSPSLFYFAPKDWAFTAAAWLGLVLSCCVVCGLADRFSSWLNAAVWAILWLLYLSFVNFGQTFYAFGWESILLEAGFYSMLLGSRHVVPQWVAMLLLRWLCFRLMFGAGLIKLRGDPCWRDMSCLDYHYETQPMPNPLSWFLHWGPVWTHQAGVWFNHFAELVAPFGYFLPQPIASITGIVTVVFQGTIFASGNLSWLNALTIVLAIPMLDDRSLGWLLPLRAPELHAPGLPHTIALGAVSVLVLWLSIDPIRNMLSPRQIMNTTFNPFHLVGTYGAFGSITKTRYEVVVEGTEEAVLTPSTKWRAYEFRGKPTDIGRLPPQVAPCHLRLDWLMWFAAMTDYYDHPWFVHFIAKLLANDKPTLSLLRSNPFPAQPPRYVRAQLYEYHFTNPQERRRTGQWWNREFSRPYFPAVSLQTPEFRRLVERMGWSP
ncbi:MAG TPA: lipase maturation factor family protein [Bryobacteraceae bacterium]|nr:lipase maturation factor family protein [Bryobacteraceae bacterium]